MLFDEAKLTKTVSMLPFKQRVAFAAACCERLLPNYLAFVVMEGWGNQTTMQQALNEIWSFLHGGVLSEQRVQELRTACEAVMPDSEDFTSIFTGPAQNAASAIIYTLECCLDGESERIAMVGRLAIHTIDDYLNIVNDPMTDVHGSDAAFDQWLEQAPLMVAEVDAQQQDLGLLKLYAEPDPDSLEDLRRSSSTKGIQPFARGMVRLPDTETDMM